LLLLQPHALTSQALRIQRSIFVHAAVVATAGSGIVVRDGLGKFLCAVIFIQEVVGDFFEVGEMAVEEGGADGEEVAVARIVYFNGAPGVLTIGSG